MYALPLDVERTGQRRPHCHSTSSAPKRYAQARVAVPPTRDCTLRAEWQRHPHCHSMSSVPRRYAPGPSGSANGTLGPEWQCHPHGTARSGPSGSAAHTATRCRAYGAAPPTLPLDVERTKTVRSRPSGSAAHTGPHAQGRVAVRLTLPLGGKRTGQRHPHCHLVVNVRGSATHTATRRRTYQNGTLKAKWQCGFGRPTG